MPRVKRKGRPLQKAGKAKQPADPESDKWDLNGELKRLAERYAEYTKSLALTESKLYKLETSYLQECSKYGNLISGYNLDEFLRENSSGAANDLSAAMEIDQPAESSSSTSTTNAAVINGNRSRKSAGLKKETRSTAAIHGAAIDDDDDDYDHDYDDGGGNTREEYDNVPAEKDRIFSRSSFTTAESLAATEGLSLHTSQQTSIQSSNSASRTITPPLVPLIYEVGGDARRNHRRKSEQSVENSSRASAANGLLPNRRQQGTNTRQSVASSSRLGTLRRESSITATKNDIQSSTESLADPWLKPLPVTSRKRGRH